MLQKRDQAWWEMPQKESPLLVGLPLSAAAFQSMDLRSSCKGVKGRWSCYIGANPDYGAARHSAARSARTRAGFSY